MLPDAIRVSAEENQLGKSASGQGRPLGAAVQSPLTPQVQTFGLLPGGARNCHLRQFSLDLTSRTEELLYCSMD